MKRLPKHCANDSCRFHRSKLLPGMLIRYGTHHHRGYGRVQRYLCKACGRTFSEQTLRLDYYAHKRLDYRLVLAAFINCGSIRGTARELRSSRSVVTNRLMRLSWKGLEELSRLGREISVDEDLSADGFESFSVSQYFPNNIHLLAGVDSQYVYAIDSTTIRRKGRMTDAQRQRRDELEQLWRADPQGIRKSFSRIAEHAVRLHAESKRCRMVLYTDCKREYATALGRSAAVRHWKEVGRFAHRTVSSRAHRGVDNPIFSVNYIDRELRKDLREHVRETVCYARNQLRQMQRLVVYLAEHNSGKRFRINQPAADTTTHARVAGAAQSAVERIRFGRYTRRALYSRVSLGEWAERIWRGVVPTPLQRGPTQQPRHALESIPYPPHRNRLQAPAAG